MRFHAPLVVSALALLAGCAVVQDVPLPAPQPYATLTVTPPPPVAHPPGKGHPLEPVGSQTTSCFTNGESWTNFVTQQGYNATVTIMYADAVTAYARVNAPSGSGDVRIHLPSETYLYNVLGPNGQPIPAANIPDYAFMANLANQALLSRNFTCHWQVAATPPVSPIFTGTGYLVTVVPGYYWGAPPYHRHIHHH